MNILEDSTINSQVDILRKIGSATNWISQDEDPIYEDSIYLTFVNVLKPRRELAILYMHELDDEKREQIWKHIEYYNEQIKLVLGL